jgi:hypothetical protein
MFRGDKAAPDGTQDALNRRCTLFVMFVGVAALCATKQLVALKRSR